MKRTHLNFLIDALGLAGMVLLFSTGLVLAHRLPPGSGGDHGLAVGHSAADKSVKLLWGLSRHDWGDIHYWIAYGLLAILAFHIVLHWKWILSVVAGKPSEASSKRLLVGVVALVFLGLLSSAPLLSSTSVQKRGQSLAPATAATTERESETAAPQRGAVADESIRGSMTFQEISASTGVPLPEIFRRAGLPADTDPQDQAGRALRGHGIQMNEFREALDQSGE